MSLNLLQQLVISIVPHKHPAIGGAVNDFLVLPAKAGGQYLGAIWSAADIFDYRLTSRHVPNTEAVARFCKGLNPGGQQFTIGRDRQPSTGIDTRFLRPLDRFRFPIERPHFAFPVFPDENPVNEKGDRTSVVIDRQGSKSFAGHSKVCQALAYLGLFVQNMKIALRRPKKQLVIRRICNAAGGESVKCHLHFQVTGRAPNIDRRKSADCQPFPIRRKSNIVHRCQEILLFSRRRFECVQLLSRFDIPKPRRTVHTARCQERAVR